MASPMINGAHNGMPLVIAPAQHFIPSNVSLILGSRQLKVQPKSLLRLQIRVFLPKIYVYNFDDQTRKLFILKRFCKIITIFP